MTKLVPKVSKMEALGQVAFWNTLGRPKCKTVTPPEGPLGGIFASSGVQKHPQKHTENHPGFRNVFLTSLGAKSNQKRPKKQAKKQARIEMMAGTLK